MTPQTFEELYNGLNRGECYILKEGLKLTVKLFMDGAYRYFVPQCNLSCDDDYKYIKWHNGGSSANKNTLEELEWILDKIFNGASPEDFVALNYNTMLDVMNGEYGKVRDDK